MTPTDRTFKLQYDIRFLFFLMGLTACVCSICFLLGRNNWAVAPSLFIDGLVFWISRRKLYLVLPGFVVGFVFGLVLNLASKPADVIATGLWVAAYGVPVFLICTGHYKIGLAALVAMIVSTYTIVWLSL